MSSVPILDTDLALILLGNPGSGKSLLTNVICGAAKFASRISASAVTTDSTSVTLDVPREQGGFSRLTIWDVNGLADSDAEKLAKNKAEIERAFQGPQKQLIGYVLGCGSGGRLINEDVTTFKALRKAFELKESAILFIFNNRSVNADATYDADMLLEAQVKLGVSDKFNYIFVDDMTIKGVNLQSQLDQPMMRSLRQRLLMQLLHGVAVRHVKHAEIQVTAEMVAEARKQAAQFKELLDQQGVEFKRQQAEAAEQHKQQLEHWKREAENNRKRGGFSIGLGPFTLSIG